MNTIADPETSKADDPLVAMACHESFNQEPYHCIGWLMNQVRDGGNIPLRKSMIFCKNSDDIKLDGEQHRNFWDTLPNDWSERITNE